jgi:LAS superfamily LD-carboxypeptidase LdcB
MLASAIALLLVFSSLFPNQPPGPLGDRPGYRPLSSLALRLSTEPTSVSRDEFGRPTAVFGLSVAEARMVLLPVDRQRALPDGYTPPDLTWMGGRMIRALVKPDLVAMIEAASRDNIDLSPISVYRAPDEQSLAFDAAVWQAMARESLDRGQAESKMARFVAPPGHSQHQLGTAVDLSTWEVNYALQPAFAETDAYRWLEQNAWQYGFVLSYTRMGEERSGYAYEPWHFRWIGRELAAVLQRDGYLNHPTLIADDYLRATEELLAYENVP